jgi:hypothetical protein
MLPMSLDTTRRISLLRERDILSARMNGAGRKRQILGSSAAILIIVLVIAVLLVFYAPPPKDIEVTILGVHQENRQFIVNVSIKNNQETTGWVDDTYLITLQGSIIDLTGAGIDEKIEPGGTRTLTFFSTQVNENIVDSPLKMSYTAFPSGITYTVPI